MKGAAVSLRLMVSKRISATPFLFDSETLEVLSDLNNIRIFFFLGCVPAVRDTPVPMEDKLPGHSRVQEKGIFKIRCGLNL